MNIEATIARRLLQVQAQRERKGLGLGPGQGLGLAQGPELGLGLGQTGGDDGEVIDGNQSLSADASLLATCDSLLDQACWL